MPEKNDKREFMLYLHIAFPLHIACLLILISSCYLKEDQLTAANNKSQDAIPYVDRIHSNGFVAFLVMLVANIANYPFIVNPFKLSITFAISFVHWVASSTYFCLMFHLIPPWNGLTGRSNKVVHILGWLFITPSIFVILGKLACTDDKLIQRGILYGNVMLIAGFLASHTPYPWNLMIGTFSLLAFFSVVKILRGIMDENQFLILNKRPTSFFFSAGTYSICLWSGFPLLWLLDFFKIISADQEAWAYTSLDVLFIIYHSSIAQIVESGRGEMLSDVLKTTVSRKKELESAKEEAETIANLQRSFLAKVTHELRTPLNSIIAFNQLLLDSSLESDQKEHVSASLTSAEALLAVINNVLQFAKYESCGKIQLEQSPFDLYQVVDNLVDIITPKVNKRKNEFIARLDEDCPQFVLGDGFRLQEVLLNLVDNAIKFTFQGQVSLSVKSKVHNNKVDLHFAVADDGIGIPQSKIHLLFKPFSQIEDASSHGGCGLGLVIAQKIVKAYGGKIVVQSKENCGSEFAFNVSVEPSAPVPQQIERSEFLESLLILIVINSRKLESFLCYQLRAWKAVPRVIKLSDLIEKQPSAKKYAIIVDFANATSPLFKKSLNLMVEKPRAIILGTLNDQLAYPTADFGFIVNIFQRTPIKRTTLLKNLKQLFSADWQEENRRSFSHVITNIPENYRILIVEDNPVNIKVISAILDRLEVKYDVVRNGLEAIKAVQESGYDIIFMDVRMPIMDGIEATKQIRKMEIEGKISSKHKPLLPIRGTMSEENLLKSVHRHYIVAMTANVSAEEQGECYEADMDHFISKPVHPSIVHDTIETHVSKTRRLHDIFDRILK